MSIDYNKAISKAYEADAQYSDGNYDIIYDSDGLPMIVAPDYDKTGKAKVNAMLDRAKYLAGEVVEEVGVPMAKGGIKIFENLTSLPMAVVEKTGLINQGSVKAYAKFFDDVVYPKVEQLGKPDGPLAPLIEGLVQYGVPGIGYYNLFSRLNKIKGVTKWYEKAATKFNNMMATEIATVLTAQDPVDGNFTTAVADMFEMDTNKAETMGRELFNYIASPADETTADTVIDERLKALLSDVPLALGVDVTIGIMRGYAKLFRQRDDVRRIEQTAQTTLLAPELREDVMMEDSEGNQYNFEGERVARATNE